jgi:hypothetical protein
VNAAELRANPLPVFLDSVPVEDQYDYETLLYSVNLARRAMGDDFDKIYNPADYSSLNDFYSEFLSRLGYQFNGEEKVIKLTYAYKDADEAAKFVNGFAQGLEDFMAQAEERNYTTPILQNRLAAAREEESQALDELNRITTQYNVPDLIEAPREWIRSYADAMNQTYLSDAQMRSTLAALRQIRTNRERTNLLSEPTGTPDTTIIRDLVLAGLRLRYAILSATEKQLQGSITQDSPAAHRLESEKTFLENYLQQQYQRGFDVEVTTLLMKLQEYMVEDYLYKANAEAAHTRIEQLPGLEQKVRPLIRRVNVASAKVALLERITSYVSIGESYGIHPMKVIDTGIPALRPIQPAWNTLKYLLPAALFVCTIWFALVARMLQENPVMVQPAIAEPEGGAG